MLRTTKVVSLGVPIFRVFTVVMKAKIGIMLDKLMQCMCFFVEEYLSQAKKPLMPWLRIEMQTRFDLKSNSLLHHLKILLVPKHSTIV